MYLNTTTLVHWKVFQILFIFRMYYYVGKRKETHIETSSLLAYRIVPYRRALPNRRPPPFLDVKQSMKMSLSDAKMQWSRRYKLLPKMAPRLMLFEDNSCG